MKHNQEINNPFSQTPAVKNITQKTPKNCIPPATPSPKVAPTPRVSPPPSTDKPKQDINNRMKDISNSMKEISNSMKDISARMKGISTRMKEISNRTPPTLLPIRSPNKKTESQIRVIKEDRREFQRDKGESRERIFVRLVKESSKEFQRD